MEDASGLSPDVIRREGSSPSLPTIFKKYRREEFALFKSVITTTPLTTDVANGYFENRITGQSWNRDYSFLATLRALLEPRMGDGDRSPSFLATQTMMNISSAIQKPGKQFASLQIRIMNMMAFCISTTLPALLRRQILRGWI